MKKILTCQNLAPLRVTLVTTTSGAACASCPEGFYSIDVLSYRIKKVRRNHSAENQISEAEWFLLLNKQINVGYNKFYRRAKYGKAKGRVKSFILNISNSMSVNLSLCTQECAQE